MNVLDWLSEHDDPNRFYWSSRDRQFEVAGVGISNANHARQWGKVQFDGRTHWWSPKEERLGDGSLSLCAPKFALCGEPRYALSYEQWSKCVDVALSKIEAGIVDKVVLAQRKTLTFTDAINPFELLITLKKRVPWAYHFCWSDAPHRAFLGASPECLYSRRENMIETEAQAGTRRRGVSVEEDARLKQELLSSDKDRLEHDWVQRELTTNLRELCEGDVRVGEREIVTLPNVQHLRTKLSGQLKNGVNDADILSLLHPTPAVCGLPREKARQLIETLEPFKRAEYTGAIGFRTESHAEFAVGIRCAFVDGNQLHLMAGAGLVAGSNARDEWHEIENKMSILDR